MIYSADGEDIGGAILGSLVVGWIIMAIVNAVVEAVSAVLSAVGTVLMYIGIGIGGVFAFAAAVGLLYSIGCFAWWLLGSWRDKWQDAFWDGHDWDDFDDVGDVIKLVFVGLLSPVILVITLITLLIVAIAKVFESFNESDQKSTKRSVGSYKPSPVTASVKATTTQIRSAPVKTVYQVSGRKSVVTPAVKKSVVAQPVVVATVLPDVQLDLVQFEPQQMPMKYRLMKVEIDKIAQLAKKRANEIQKIVDRYPEAFSEVGNDAFLLVNCTLAKTLYGITPRDQEYIKQTPEHLAVYERLEDMMRQSKQAAADIPSVLKAWILHMKTFVPGCRLQEILDKLRSENKVFDTVCRLRKAYESLSW